MIISSGIYQLQPGIYKWTCSKEGYITQSGKFEIVDNQTTPLNIVLVENYTSDLSYLITGWEYSLDGGTTWSTLSEGMEISNSVNLKYRVYASFDWYTSLGMPEFEVRAGIPDALVYNMGFINKTKDIGNGISRSSFRTIFSSVLSGLEYLGGTGSKTLWSTLYIDSIEIMSHVIHFTIV